MRQQEANQFDKGMSLDTNPIAMDNHTLSGALNATMLTMNGNELVLQNDMGNAKVESASLSAGYIPVGMKEYGGIVYVASYNPKTKESQIGSFPSPELNQASTETTEQSHELTSINIGDDGYITQTSVSTLLIDGPLRPGDQFRITSKNIDALKEEVNNNLVEVKIITKGSDGQSIEISGTGKDQIGEFPDYINTKDYITYGKIPGSLYIQEDLILPSYIQTGLTADNIKEGEKEYIKITLTPVAYSSKGTLWSTENPINNEKLSYSYSYTLSGSKLEESTNTIKIEKPKSDDVVLNYTVTPQYEYSEGIIGKIKLLEKTNSISISQIGTGLINFSKFRYYNDTDNQILTVDYDIQAYLGSNHIINEIYLELREYLGNNTFATSTSMVKRMLSTQNYWGSFTEQIPYSSSDDTNSDKSKILAGKVYLCRLCASRSNKTNVDDPTEYKSKWYLLITSAITNEIYMTETDSSMIEIDSLDNQKTINLDWKINWTQNQISDNYTDELPDNTESSYLNTGTPMPLEKPDSNIIAKTTRRTGALFVKYTPKITVNTVDNFFPFKYTAKAFADCDTATYNISDYEKVGNLSTQKLLGSNVEETTIPNKENNVTDTNEVWFNKDYKIYEEADNQRTESITIKTNYCLYSQFFAKLASNGAVEGDQYVQSYETSNCPALVPYITNFPEDSETIMNITGADYYYNESNGTYSDIRPQTWWTLEQWQGDKNSRHRTIGVIYADEDYKNVEDRGALPGQGETNDHGSYTIFDTTSSNAYWKYYSQVTMDYLNNNMRVYPSMFLWQGDAGSSRLRYPEGQTQNYSIPILVGSNNEMYVLGQYQLNLYNTNLLTKMIKCFSNIYIYQDNQYVKYDYYKSSNDFDSYIYTKPYTATITNNLKVTTEFTLNNYNPTNNKYTVDSSEDSTFYLPKFELNFNPDDGSDLVTFTSTISAYDQTAENINYLDAEPSLGNIAIIKYISGGQVQQCIQTLAYKPDLVSKTELIPAHLYYKVTGDGPDAKLVDCNLYNPESISISENKRNVGHQVAIAIYKKYLKQSYSTNNERNMIYINPTGITSVIMNSCNVSIGDNSKNSNLGDIAKSHLLNLQLFEKESGDTPVYTITKYS